MHHVKQGDLEDTNFSLIKMLFILFVFLIFVYSLNLLGFCLFGSKIIFKKWSSKDFIACIWGVIKKKSLLDVLQ